MLDRVAIRQLVDRLLAGADDRTREMMDRFGALVGVPYPWSKYAQVVVSDFIFGGMENTGATTMYEHVLYDERAALDVTSDDLVAHELAHQWFGDLVTMRWWDDLWLNEGFASWMESRMTARLHPEWNTRLGAVGSRDGAMQRDSVATTHPAQLGSFLPKRLPSPDPVHCWPSDTENGFVGSFTTTVEHQSSVPL